MMNALSEAGVEWSAYKVIFGCMKRLDTYLKTLWNFETLQRMRLVTIHVLLSISCSDNRIYTRPLHTSIKQVVADHDFLCISH
jgi:hypothetical protein